MSKRFGRQQRRKMREQVESLSARADGLATSLSHAIRSAAESRRIVEETAQILGRHFLALTPESGVTGEPISEYAYIRQFAERHINFYDGKLDDLSLKSRPAEFVDHALAVLKVLPADMRPEGQVHYYFTLGSKRFGYAISTEMTKRLPRQYAIEKIAEAIATLMVDSGEI
jgi:hypothetical protein